MMKLDFGGSDLNEYLTNLLSDKGYNFNTTGELYAAMIIKD